MTGLFLGGQARVLPALITARFDRYTVALVRHNYSDEGDCIFETLYEKGARMHSDSHYTLWRIEDYGPMVLVIEHWPEMPLQAHRSLLTQLELQVRGWGVEVVR